MESASLNERISQFYDQSTNLWLDAWGEHMHHGYYGENGLVKKDRRQAQVDLIVELLKWGGVNHATRILDAGCGVGGSARYLAKRFDAQVFGVTLSPVQAEKAQYFSEKAGLQNKVAIKARDILDIDKSDGQFDLIWSLESAEHISQKERLLEIFYERLKPGGKFLMATWCIRNEPPLLWEHERALLNNLSHFYHLPSMISIEVYSKLADKTGFQQVQTADWSDAVAPFWNAVIRSAVNFKNFAGLFRSGFSTLKGAWAIQYMTKGYRMGTIRFGVVQGQKP